MNKKYLSMKNGLSNWLSESGIVTADGSVYSWLNPENPGYVYNEIMGYYTKFATFIFHSHSDNRFLDLANRSSKKIISQINNLGGVNRDEITYVFDSSICASGILSLSKVRKLSDEEVAGVRLLSDFVSESLSKNFTAFLNNQNYSDKSRWSLSFGSLHLKTIIGLYEAAIFFKEESYLETCQLVHKKIIRDCFDEGRFSINKYKKWTYTHPHCYATEGLIFFDHVGFSDNKKLISQSADWLAESQNEDGSLYGWYNRNNIKFTKQNDATSQAVRIWIYSDKEKYKDNIAKALNFLSNYVSTDGGLYYNNESKDINSWVSMFCFQALDWQLNGPKTDFLI